MYPKADQIINAVASYYACPNEALTSASRSRSLSFARSVAMYLIRKYTIRSLAETGALFGGRGHTSAKKAETKIAELLRSDAGLQHDLRVIEGKIEALGVLKSKRVNNT